MNRTICFTKRNIKEMSRDPLSYIFCIAFPIVMLVIMTLVNDSIPAESGQTVFRIDNLAGGVVIFGQTFVMLFTALAVANDRAGSFLNRLFATPMKSKEFTAGYILPMLIISIIQSVLTFVAAYIISLIVGYSLNPLGLLLAIVTTIPSALMFIAIGLIFGTIFSEKSAPGLCSVLISLGSFVGAIWFDAEKSGGVMYTICKCLPFIYCTKTARASIKLDFTFDGFVLPIIIVTLTAAVLMFLGIFVFRRKMKADLA